MSDTSPEQQEQVEPTKPLVASILSSDQVVINSGEKDGIQLGQRFLIYELSDEEIIDPATNESLGYLEIPKGTGRIASVQENMAVLESDQERTSKPGPWSGVIDAITAGAKAPFRDPEVGDPLKWLN